MRQFVHLSKNKSPSVFYWDWLYLISTIHFGCWHFQRCWIWEKKYGEKNWQFKKHVGKKGGKICMTEWVSGRWRKARRVGNENQRMIKMMAREWVKRICYRKVSGMMVRGEIWIFSSSDFYDFFFFFKHSYINKSCGIQMKWTVVNDIKHL